MQSGNPNPLEEVKRDVKAPRQPDMAYIEVTEQVDKNNGLLDVNVGGGQNEPFLAVHAANEGMAENLKKYMRGAIINFAQTYSKNAFFHVEETNGKAIKMVGNIYNALNEMKERNYISTNHITLFLLTMKPDLLLNLANSMIEMCIMMKL